MRVPTSPSCGWDQDARILERPSGETESSAHACFAVSSTVLASSGTSPAVSSTHVSIEAHVSPLRFSEAQKTGQRIGTSASARTSAPRPDASEQTFEAGERVSRSTLTQKLADYVRIVWLLSCVFHH